MHGLVESMESGATQVRKELTGLLPINKPAGMTSKDVSRKLQHLLPRKTKIGHVGTLDPIATGVLPIVLGRATRLQDLLLDLPKTYLFDVAFGYETDTLDTEGEVTKRSENTEMPTEAQIREVLPQFIGEIEQIPPIYSAVKYKGKPLYKYARNNPEDLPDLAELKRFVSVFDLEFVQLNEAGVRLRATSSRGTYVRALGRDIAAVLGTFGTITMLERSRSAGIDIEVCATLEDLCGEKKSIEDVLLPIEDLSGQLPYWRSLAPVWTQRLRNGQILTLKEDLFDQALEGQKHSNILNRDLLLLSDHGRVFGLGKAVAAGPGEFIVNMKRGLQ